MVMESNDNFEVDPSVMAGGGGGNSSELQRRRDRLVASCQLVWYKIINSQSHLPRYDICVLLCLRVQLYLCFIRCFIVVYCVVSSNDTQYIWTEKA